MLTDCAAKGGWAAGTPRHKTACELMGTAWKMPLLLLTRLTELPGSRNAMASGTKPRREAIRHVPALFLLQCQTCFSSLRAVSAEGWGSRVFSGTRVCDTIRHSGGALFTQPSLYFMFPCATKGPDGKVPCMETGFQKCEPQGDVHPENSCMNKDLGQRCEIQRGGMPLLHHPGTI